MIWFDGSLVQCHEVCEGQPAWRAVIAPNLLATFTGFPSIPMSLSFTVNSYSHYKTYKRPNSFVKLFFADFSSAFNKMQPHILNDQSPSNYQLPDQLLLLHWYIRIYFFRDRTLQEMTQWFCLIFRIQRQMTVAPSQYLRCKAGFLDMNMSKTKEMITDLTRHDNTHKAYTINGTDVV